MKSPKAEKPPRSANSVKYRQEVGAPAYRKKWGRVSDAIACSGLNKTEIFRLIKTGLIVSFIYKFDPAATSGARLIDLESLTEYLDKRAALAKAESEAK